MIRKMRNSCLVAIGALLLVSAVYAGQSEAAQVNLPAVRFAAPPSVVVIPGTYVYMVPDSDADVLFFQGYWWRPYEGRWYRSGSYNGRWSYIDSRRVPGGLRGLPQDYRQRISPGHDRIAHRDVQKNWKKWEKEKHWDNRGEQGRGGHGEHDRGKR
jgi:hypothetical protein